MRVTNSMQYRDIYGENNKTGQALFDVNKQISSGQKIQYAHEDNATFIDTMRLDNEVTTLTQVKKSTQSAYKFSTQTDTVLGDFSKALDTMKVKLINAANGTHSDASLNAIAQELRGLESHLKNLADTSINGQYLFSGTQTSTKPLDNESNYTGNDGALNAFLGNDIKQKYNISGADLFLGEESNTQRKITTNIKQLSLNDLYPDVMQSDILTRGSAQEKYITTDNTIRDLMGDTDNDTTNDAISHFYIRGTKSDGTSFKQSIAMTSDQKVGELLSAIETKFGAGSVDVSLNEHGQIEIKDKLSGSSKLDFHMIGAVDFDTTGDDLADINDAVAYPAPNTGSIDNLSNGETDFKKIIDGVSAALNPSLHVKEFNKSALTSAVATTADGLMYDRTLFAQDGMKLQSNVSQILKDDNSFAVDATKLGDVFSNISSTRIRVEGLQTDGVTPYSVDVVFGANPATDIVEVRSVPADALLYNVGDGKGNDTVAADMTYRQLLDVVNMAMNGEVPTDNNADYRAKIQNANANSSIALSNDGKIVLKDLTNSSTSTKATLAMYDTSSDNFTTNASVATFNANTALTIRDPKTNFFSQIDEAIKAVEEGRYRADGDAKDPRNGGIQNGIAIIDDLNEHVNRMQSQAGSQSQSLSAAINRTDMLLVNTKILRSEVIDVDIAEATLQLQQLTLNYQAMFSSISRISQLSLVNYL